MTETPKFAPETETCTRCGGTGRHSYCQMYGTTCMKCGGSGRHLTKRGAAAADYLKALRSRPAAAVVAGDLVLDAVTGRRTWLRVASVTVKGGTVEIRLANGSMALSTTVAADRLVRVAGTPEQEQEWVAKAAEYQASLGKNGKPSKA